MLNDTLRSLSVFRTPSVAVHPHAYLGARIKIFRCPIYFCLNPGPYHLPLEPLPLDPGPGYSSGRLLRTRAVSSAAPAPPVVHVVRKNSEPLVPPSTPDTATGSSRDGPDHFQRVTRGTPPCPGRLCSLCQPACSRSGVGGSAVISQKLDALLIFL